MRKVILMCSMLCFVIGAYACTNIIVGKKASKDGSVFVSYNADSYGCYGEMKFFPASVNPQGTMRKVFDWESNRYLGEIPEAPVTYKVVGNSNEFQLTIAETTFGGREELVDTTGIIDYGSLIYITLQRAKTAREAIQIMTNLVADYGYCSEGETFSIADPNEAWIMEMVGKGPGVKGALWVAVKIPDNAVCVHANQSRIHKFTQYGKNNYLCSKDLVSFAKKKGWYNGKDADFDFANTYCPLDFSGARACEARVWAIYNHYVKGMNAYLDYAMGKNLKAEPMPLFIVPDHLISIKDVMMGMRDQYEGTPMEMTNDPGAGVYLSPTRTRPLFWEQDNKKYFNERPVGTIQTSFTFVAQMRSSLPDVVGGVLWFGHDDAQMVPYTPVYFNSSEIPECYSMKHGDDVTFSMESAFWVQNWVSNMVYPRYSLLFPDLKANRDSLENLYFDKQEEIEKKALEFNEISKEKAIAYLTKYSLEKASEMMDCWKKLAFYLIVKYNDGVIKPEKNGSFELTPYGRGAHVKNVGYPEATRKRIIKETGNKFLVPEVK